MTGAVDDIQLRRQIQDVGHCGPTTVSMLLDHVGQRVSPKALVDAAKINDRIREHGSRVFELGNGVRACCPGYDLLAMYETSLSVIDEVVRVLRTPLGVEYQGTFRGEVGNFNIGHYSAIVGLRMSGQSLQEVTVADPDPASIFFEMPRISGDDFLQRWWEDNEISPGKRGRSRRLSFVVAQNTKQNEFRSLGFLSADWQLFREHNRDL